MCDDLVPIWLSSHPQHPDHRASSLSPVESSQIWHPHPGKERLATCTYSKRTCSNSLYQHQASMSEPNQPHTHTHTLGWQMELLKLSYAHIGFGLVVATDESDAYCTVYPFSKRKSMHWSIDLHCTSFYIHVPHRNSKQLAMFIHLSQSERSPLQMYVILTKQLGRQLLLGMLNVGMQLQAQTYVYPRDPPLTTWLHSFQWLHPMNMSCHSGRASDTSHVHQALTNYHMYMYTDKAGVVLGGEYVYIHMYNVLDTGVATPNAACY